MSFAAEVSRLQMAMRAYAEEHNGTFIAAHVAIREIIEALGIHRTRSEITAPTPAQIAAARARMTKHNGSLDAFQRGGCAESMPSIADLVQLLAAPPSNTDPEQILQIFKE